MKYQIVYESRSGNTELVAQAIAACLPKEQTELINLDVQMPTRDADVYCVGFGVRYSTCPMRVLEFLELLNRKTILLFATCGMPPTERYHDILERSIEPFLPDSCDYRGLFLCQGSIGKDGFTALNYRFENNIDEETLLHFEEFCLGTYEHPTECDLENAQEFVWQALDLERAL